MKRYWVSRVLFGVFLLPALEDCNHSGESCNNRLHAASCEANVKAYLGLFQEREVNLSPVSKANITAVVYVLEAILYDWQPMASFTIPTQLGDTPYRLDCHEQVVAACADLIEVC